jgi:hypothetical protein
MRILFVMHTPRFVRYFDETMAELVGRGHTVLLAFSRTDLKAENLRALETLENSPVILGAAPERGDPFARIAPAVRAGVDYLRYLSPPFASAHFLRERARLKAGEYVPEIERLQDLPGLRRAWRPLLALGLAAERSIPSAPEIEAWLRELRPDVVLVSPLVNIASREVDVVKSARALGIPSGALIASWDNLTTKGLLREIPDAVFVWNRTQADEALQMHHVPPERLRVTGAQNFDRWFDRRPATTRQDFCERAGLPADRPFVLYVGSTSNINAPDWEDDFIRKWIVALRSAPSPVHKLGVLVRPHPDRRGEWLSDDLADVPDAVVWPHKRPNPVEPEARAGYFDSLFHSAAVVGVNTSAMVEAAIIGRPVLTIRVSDFQQAQEGTLHFQYLRADRGGFVHEAAGLAEHVDQLSAILDDPAAAQRQLEHFVAHFIRPRGLERAALPILVEEVEELARILPAPAPTAAWQPILRSALGSADRFLLNRSYRVRLVRRQQAARRLAAQAKAKRGPIASLVFGLRQHVAHRRLIREKERHERVRQERYRAKDERAELKARLRQPG